MTEGVVDVWKIASEDNLANPFTKTLVATSFERHVEAMAMRDMTHLLAWGKWKIVKNTLRMKDILMNFIILF